MRPFETVFVLSGGGAKGAWQIGVMQALGEAGVVPDAVFGTSVGARNVAGLCLNGIDDLTSLWESIDGSRDIQRCALWKNFWAKGVYHFGPLRKKLEQRLGPSPGTPSAFAVYIDINTNCLCTMSQHTAKDRAEYIDAILGSSSLGFFHEPIRDRWVDAGHKEAMPISSAKRNGAKKIIAIGTEPMTFKRDDFSLSWPYIVSSGMRTLGLMSREIYLNDIFQHKNDPDVTIITPNAPLEIGGMEYNHDAIMKAIDMGREHGRRYAVNAMD